MDANRFAIPALHFRSAHPETLKIYEDLGRETSFAPRDYFARWRDRFAGPLSLPDSNAADRCDLLFVSHLTATDQWQQASTDTYFGTLPWQLTAMGQRCRIALIDHVSTPYADFPKASRTDVERVLLPRRLDRSAETGFSRSLARTAQVLLWGSDFADLRRLAARQAGQGPARQSLRIATSIARLVARHQPKALIITYEGHAWERMAMHLCRKVDPSLRCLAVHHAILAPMQHAMTMRYGGSFDPDVILAAGRAALDWLSNTPSLSGMTIDLLGSPKARASSPAPTALKDGLVCLFLPEGMLSESCRLAHAAYELARARPDVRCVIRLHPLTSRAELASAESRFASTPPNVEWSPPNRMLDEDGRRATWAVYRGSSAVLSAMTAGALPVYVGNEPPDLRIDPLRGAGDIVQTVRNDAELAKDLQFHQITLDRVVRGCAFAQDYYTPMDPSAILRHMIDPTSHSQAALDTE